MKSNSTLIIKAFGLSTLIILLMVAPVCVQAVNSAVSLQGKYIRINPELKIKRSSNGAVIVTTKDPNNDQVHHEFKDFYADLLMGAYRNQGIEYITDTLMKKYYLSEDDCRREIKHAIIVLTEWNIVLRDDPVAHR